jgi:VanZ family protein
MQLNSELPAMRYIRYYWPAIIWVIIVMVLCTIPGNDLPSDPLFEKIHLDKIVHLGLFGVTVFLLCLGYYRQHGHITRVNYSLFAISASFYGLIIEYIQKYIATNRSFDMSDVAADIVGAVAGILAFKLVRKWWLK